MSFVRYFSKIPPFYCFIEYNISRSLEEDKQPKPVSQSISKTSDSDMTKVSNRTIKVRLFSKLSELSLRVSDHA